MDAGPLGAGSSSALTSPATLASDAFKVYCYKIVPCAKKFGHDWSECPFAHEGEKATRRCPALYLYSSIVCPDVRQSKPCPRGDVCPYSHSIFEYWMHPARFRAQICSFGPECNRRICFFAHAQEQLRVPSEPLVGDALASRAPYLQGRVCPKSRFALYPDQVPAAMPLGGGGGGMQQPGAYLGQPDLGAMAGQMVLVPMDGGGGGLGAGPVAGQLAALQQQQQQWAGAGGGGGMMYMPASPAGQPGGGSMGGYYAALPAPGQPGGVGGAMLPHQQFGGAMGHMPGGPMPVPGGSGGALYGARQPVPLMGAVGADAGVSAYPAMQQPGSGSGGAAAGLPGGGALGGYAPPPMYAGAASMPMAAQQQHQQPPWAAQQHQQPPARGEQVQQQLQALMQAAKGAEGVPPPGAADAFLLAQQQQQQPFVHQPQPRSIGGVEAPGYAVLGAAPGGPAGVVPSPQAHGGGGAAACGGSDAGAAAGASSSGQQQVDELSQQIGGWRIT